MAMEAEQIARPTAAATLPGPHRARPARRPGQRTATSPRPAPATAIAGMTRSAQRASRFSASSTPGEGVDPRDDRSGKGLSEAFASGRGRRPPGVSPAAPHFAKPLSRDQPQGRLELPVGVPDQPG